MTMHEWEIFKEQTNTHSSLFIEELIKGGVVQIIMKTTYPGSLHNH